VIEGTDQLASLNLDNATNFDVIVIGQRSIESQAHPKQKQPCALEVQDPNNKERVVDRLGDIILKMKSKRSQIIMRVVAHYGPWVLHVTMHNVRAFFN
jgi:hypothetical protein